MNSRFCGSEWSEAGQVAVALEQQIDSDTKVTLGYTHNSTWALQRRIDRNLFPPTTLPNGLPVYPTVDSRGNLLPVTGFNTTTGLPFFVDSTGATVTAKVIRPDPTVGQINVNESVGHSSYSGTYVSIQRRMSHRLQFGINYTYSFNRDDDSNERDFNRQYQINVYNLKLDAAYARNDNRHSGNVNFLYDLGHGFTISTLLMGRSGFPGRYVIGTAIENDGNKNNARPIINGKLVPRDSTRLPTFFNWDMRLLKEFKIGERSRVAFSIEGFNLTASGNKSFNTDGESSFGKPTATPNPITGYFYATNTAGVPINAPGTDRFGGPRQGQVGVRVTF